MQGWQGVQDPCGLETPSTQMPTYERAPACSYPVYSAQQGKACAATLGILVPGKGEQQPICTCCE